MPDANKENTINQVSGHTSKNKGFPYFLQVIETQLQGDVWENMLRNAVRTLFSQRLPCKQSGFCYAYAGVEYTNSLKATCS